MSCLLFVGLFLVSLAFQYRSGAWHSDFGGHADEGAHVVTSLMVRDYLSGGFLETPHPMRYAQAYYARFPKVALGHYPPGFYLAASVILLPFRSGAALLLLMNALAAVAALLVRGFAMRLGLGRIASVALAFAYLILPQTRTYTAIIMADLLLVLLALLAARSFALFLRSGTARDSLLFGFWAALAILTKGSGVGLALLPPITLALASKWRWFLKPALWLAPLPVLVLTVPWMWLTVGITSEGMQEGGLPAWVKAAVPFYGDALIREVGWTGLGLLVVAAALGPFRRRIPGDQAVGEEPVLWALLAGGLAVPLLVPAGLDSRYLMPVVPAILLLGAGSIRELVCLRAPAFGTASVLIAALCIGVETWRPVRKYYTGATAAMRSILGEREGDSGPGPARVLVVSDAAGEGALIAAAALTAPGTFVVARGTKLLSTSDWMGRGYRSAVPSREEFTKRLAAEGIRYLVIDPPPSETPLVHWQLIHQWLDPTSGGGFRQIAEVPSWRREVESRFSIYQVAE